MRVKLTIWKQTKEQLCSNNVHTKKSPITFKKCRKWTVPEQVSLETLPPSIRWRNPARLISLNCSPIVRSSTVLNQNPHLGLVFYAFTSLNHCITTSLQRKLIKLTNNKKVAGDFVLTGVFWFPADRIRVPVIDGDRAK